MRKHENNKIKLLGVLVFSFVALALTANKAEAVGPCLCKSFDTPPKVECIAAADIAACESNFSCQKATWEGSDASCDAAALSYRTAAPYLPGSTPPPQTTQSKSNLSALITKCGQAGKLSEWPSECTDVTVFISLGLDLTKYLFGIIGSVALLFFVYGGFVFILSQGNPERVTHGKAILINAVIGIVVAFSGYALVRFLGAVVGIESVYTLL